jgi:rubrerythrin
MFEQTALAEQFEDLLAKERAAAGRYAELAAECRDPAQRQQFETLRREKLRHVELTRRLIEIVEA